VALPLGADRPTLQPYEDGFLWTKPVLILTNAQSGSCGDIFPHLMAESGIAKTFGERTGGWGGNVEDFDLPISKGKFRITRSLFNIWNGSKEIEKYDRTKFLENHGQPVSKPAKTQAGKPNPFDRSLTVDDFRNGFVDYFRDFSEVAVSL
jgi:hypothetical protein